MYKSVCNRTYDGVSVTLSGRHVTPPGTYTKATPIIRDHLSSFRQPRIACFIPTISALFPSAGCAVSDTAAFRPHLSLSRRLSVPTTTAAWAFHVPRRISTISMVTAYRLSEHES